MKHPKRGQHKHCKKAGAPYTLHLTSSRLVSHPNAGSTS